MLIVIINSIGYSFGAVRSPAPTVYLFAFTNEIKKKNSPVHFNSSVITLNTPTGDLCQLAALTPRVAAGHTSSRASGK